MMKFRYIKQKIEKINKTYAILIAIASLGLGIYRCYYDNSKSDKMLIKQSEQDAKRIEKQQLTELVLEIKAVKNELEKHLIQNGETYNPARKIVNENKSLKITPQKRVIISGEPIKINALMHFISGGSYIKLHNESLNKELIYIISLYEKVNVSRERYEQYCWYGQYESNEKFKTENDLADKWLVNIFILNQEIFKVVDLLNKEILRLEKIIKN